MSGNENQNDTETGTGSLGAAAGSEAGREIDTLKASGPSDSSGPEQRTSGARRNSEALSALLDGEAEALELRRLLATATAGSEEAQEWRRLTLAQAVLHGEGAQLRPVSEEFASRVMQQIDADAVGVIAEASDMPTQANVVAMPWAQGLAKVAVAASVALAFVVALQTALPTGEAVDSVALVAGGLPETAGELAVDPAQRAGLERAVANSGQALTSMNLSAAESAAQQRLRDYIASMTVSADEPLRAEHIQDSPLYRLVSETIEAPIRR